MKASLAIEYINYNEWLLIIKQKCHENNIENLEKIFDNYIINYDTKSIQSQNIPRILKQFIHEALPSYIIDIVLKLASNHISERLISWDSFVRVIHQAVDLIEQQNNRKVETPCLVKLMNKEPIVDKSIGPTGNMSSMYRDTIDFTAKNKILKSSVNFSRTLPQSTWNTINDTFALDPSQNALTAGTHKGTYHIPGYSGHIPRNKRSIRKLEHSLGSKYREVKANLVLTKSGTCAINGYSGNIIF